MTPAKAAKIRAVRIDGGQATNQARREKELLAKAAEENRWTIRRLWEEYKRQRPTTKTLIVDDSRFVCHIAPTLGEKEPRDIITLDADRLRVRLLKTLAPQTVKHVLALLKRIIRFGVQKGLCEAPDAHKLHIEIPPVDNIKTEDLDAEELARLMEAMDADSNQKVANMMRLALFTGMRRGELFRLEWQDIDFERGFILIREPKGGKSQSIPLNAPAREVLSNIERTDGPLVFPNPQGKPLQNIQPSLRRIRRRAGLPEDFRCMHGLRHVYASMLASSGKVDMYTLQKLLTHKSPQMTQRYAHLRDEALKRAADVAGDLFDDLARHEHTTTVINMQLKHRG